MIQVNKKKKHKHSLTSEQQQFQNHLQDEKKNGNEEKTLNNRQGNHNFEANAT
jgi:hypothetical protein